jgi:hypothetical protein
MVNSILHQAASHSLVQKKTKKRPHKTQPWFNSSLRHLRHKLNYTANLLKKFPKDPAVRSKYFKMAKEYKQKVKYCKRQFKQDIINELDDLRERAPRQYWKLLNKLKNEQGAQDRVSQIQMRNGSHISNT